MYVKSADTFSFVFDFVPDWYKTQETCDKKVEFFSTIIKICSWFVCYKKNHLKHDDDLL